MLVEESPSDRVMEFVDLRNIMDAELVRVRRASGWELDFSALARGLPGQRRLVGAYMFDTLRKSQSGYISGLSLVRALRHQGFRVVAPTDEPEEVGPQKEADVLLATELLVQAHRDSYDVAIVVSGDRDFIPAIRAVQGLGKRVEVAAFQGTYIARLKEAADRFHILDELPCLRKQEAPV